MVGRGRRPCGKTWGASRSWVQTLAHSPSRKSSHWSNNIKKQDSGNLEWPWKHFSACSPDKHSSWLTLGFQWCDTLSGRAGHREPEFWPTKLWADNWCGIRLLGFSNLLERKTNTKYCLLAVLSRDQSVPFAASETTSILPFLTSSLPSPGRLDSSPCCSVCPDNWGKGRSGPRCGAYTLWRDSTHLSSPNCWLDVAGHLKLRSHVWERAALCLPGVLNEGVEQNPALYRHTNTLQCCGVRNVHSATSPGPEGLCIPAPNTGFVDSYPSFIPLLLSKCQVSYNWDGLWVQKKIWHKKIPVLRGFSLSGGGGEQKLYR